MGGDGALAIDGFQHIIFVEPVVRVTGSNQDMDHVQKVGHLAQPGHGPLRFQDGRVVAYLLPAIEPNPAPSESPSPVQKATFLSLIQCQCGVMVWGSP